MKIKIPIQKPKNYLVPFVMKRKAGAHKNKKKIFLAKYEKQQQYEFCY